MWLVESIYYVTVMEWPTWNEFLEWVLSGETIHEQLRELEGIEKITTALPDWPISDDTVMHLATAEGYSGVRMY